MLSNIVYLKPLSSVLPIGFTPKAKSLTDKVNKNIDIVLDSVIDRKNRNAVKVPVEKVEIVLKAIFSTIVPDENTNRFISCEKMISILRYNFK